MAKFKNYHFTLKASVVLLSLPLITFYVGGDSSLIVHLKHFVLVVSLPLSVILAVTFLILKRFHPEYKGGEIATVTLTLAVLSMLLIFSYTHFIMNQFHIPNSIRMDCRENMEQIYKGLLKYAEKNEGYLPSGEVWCDALLEDGYLKAEDLICPNMRDDRMQSSYILNAAAAGSKLEDISEQAFLLYEDTCGWNQTRLHLEINQTNHKVSYVNFVNVLHVNGKIQSCPKRGKSKKLRINPRDY